MFPENSNNMLVKAVSFYLKGFQRYGVLKKCIIFSVTLYFSGVPDPHQIQTVSRTSTFHVHGTCVMYFL